MGSEIEVRYILSCNKFSGYAGVEIFEVEMVEFSDSRSRRVTEARIGEDIGARVDLVLAKDMKRLDSLQKSGRYGDIASKMQPLTWDQYEQSRPAEERGTELDPIEKRLMKTGLSDQPVRVYSFVVDGYRRASPIDMFAMQLLSDVHEDRVNLVRLDAYLEKFNQALAKPETSKENKKTGPRRVFSSVSGTGPMPLAAVAAPYGRY